MSGVACAQHCLVSALIAFTVLTPGARVSAQDVGKIDHARTTARPQQCAATPAAAPREPTPAPPSTVQLRRAAAWQPLTRFPEDIAAGTGVRVERNVDARVATRIAGSGTSIVLVPGLVCDFAASNNAIVRGIQTHSGDLGEYALSVETVRHGLFRRERRLILDVERGAVLVFWTKEADLPLYVRAAGETVRITGSTVAVMVDSTSNEGLYYLEEGEAWLENLPGYRPIAGELYVMRRGAPTVAIGAAPTLTTAIQYHAANWPPLPQPGSGWGWRRTSLVAGAVAGAAYLGYQLLKSDDADGGTVIIRW